MLVLLRTVNQTIVISDTIKVTVLSVQGGRIKLGIEAPSDIAVRRVEAHNQQPEQLDK